MKKQNNILACIKQIASLALISIVCYACSDEEIISPKVNVIEGVPVEVSLNLNVPGMQKVTTRLSDEEEFQVNDLYVFVFDANSKKIKDGTRYYNKEEILNAFTGSQNGTTSTGNIKLKTTSGKSLIYGIANVGGNDLGGNITERLNNEINTLDELKAFTVELSNKGNVDRTSPTLVMSGTYEDSNYTNQEAGYCIIPATSSNLKGTIKLTRLDSHITFKIQPLMKGDRKKINGATIEGKILSFTPTTWKVYNVPNCSYLIAQDKDAMSSESNYTPTGEKMIKPSADNIYSFAFYMLENRKESKPWGVNNEKISDYAQREAEEKTSEGLNTGIYKFVEPHATFVEIKAHIELEQENTDNGRRIADVTYVVHLGYVNNDPTDFKSLRNKKYTYNISIINVDNIVAEVESGDKAEEKQPGAEGDVVDSKTEVKNIDCHYGYIILGFDYTEVEKGLNFFVKTPYGETTQADIDEKNAHDYKWIKFKRNNGNNSSALEKYPVNGNELIDLFGLKADIESWHKTSNDKTFYYTVFIDEYYYEKHPCGTETWERAQWEQFVNKENRYALLLFSPKESHDKESSYAGAKYMITQKSIQTYYSKSETALGMEHVNETGKPTYKGGSMGNNATYGYANIYEKWNKANLSTYANVTKPYNNTFEMNSDTRDAIYDCMSRNRDEDGNGKIDGKEIKWYLPATQQLVGMFLGAESLTTPLFSDADTEPYRSDKDVTDGTYHYLTSDNKRIWAEEGASFGPVSVGWATDAEKLRCVRNLGVKSQTQIDNPTSNPTSNPISNVFTYNTNTRILRMNYMNNQSIRTSKATDSELALHHNFSDTNRPYTAFQVAEKIISQKGIGVYQSSKWDKMVKINELNHSACVNYFENSDESDKGSWRAPNQREVMLMYMVDNNLVKGNVGGGSSGSYSRTAWKFNDAFHFGVAANQMFMDRYENGGSYLRCVRDRD